MNSTSFEQDIAGQAAALRKLCQTPMPANLNTVELADYRRIVVTGMGSSHFAGLRSWRRLLSAGLPAWWVDTGQLLDSPALVDRDTLLIITSQSGASGEVVALLERVVPRTVIGVTNRPDSPLGANADVTMLLHCGPEKSISTKSYLNTLAAHEALLDHLLATERPRSDRMATAVARTVGAPVLHEAAAELAKSQLPRLAYVGYSDHVATALYAGLITKEAAKVAAEGYSGGQFRHGPLELAGPGLIAVVFGASHQSHPSMHRLASDVAATGATVVTVGDLDVVGAHHVRTPGADVFEELMTGAVVAQLLTVEIAWARGITAGEFTYAEKVTTAL